jgi:hypothetical protein
MSYADESSIRPDSYLREMKSDALYFRAPMSKIGRQVYKKFPILQMMEKILKGESIAHISSQKKLKPYSKTIVLFIIGRNKPYYK